MNIIQIFLLFDNESLLPSLLVLKWANRCFFFRPTLLRPQTFHRPTDCLRHITIISRRHSPDDVFSANILLLNCHRPRGVTYRPDRCSVRDTEHHCFDAITKLGDRRNVRRRWLEVAFVTRSYRVEVNRGRTIFSSTIHSRSSVAVD